MQADLTHPGDLVVTAGSSVVGSTVFGSVLVGSAVVVLGAIVEANRPLVTWTGAVIDTSLVAVVDTSLVAVARGLRELLLFQPAMLR